MDKIEEKIDKYLNLNEEGNAIFAQRLLSFTKEFKKLTDKMEKLDPNSKEYKKIEKSSKALAKDFISM